jgi:hypothetical protein
MQTPMVSILLVPVYCNLIPFIIFLVETSLINSYYKPRSYNPCEINPCKNSGMCISILDGRGKFKSYICQCRNPEHIGRYFLF